MPAPSLRKALQKEPCSRSPIRKRRFVSIGKNIRHRNRPTSPKTRRCARPCTFFRRGSKYKLEGRADPRFGAFTRDEWLSTQKFFFDVGVINKQPDVGEYFTNDLIDDVNRFDKAAIVQKAESYR